MKPEARSGAILTQAEWGDLRKCSIAARGVLLDIMHLIGQTSSDGTLRLEKQILLRFIGLDAAEFDELLAELTNTGILKSDNGNIESPRLAHKARISEIRTRSGRMGGRPRTALTESKK